MGIAFAIDLLDHLTSFSSLVPIICDISPRPLSLDLFTVVPGPTGSVVDSYL